MSKELNDEKRITILQALKRIFIDNPENTNEIPGLDEIEPSSEEEAKILDVLKNDAKRREINFRKRYIDENSISRTKLQQEAKNKEVNKEKNYSDKER